VRIIDTEALGARIAAGQRLWLVHAAEAVTVRSAHLPGALTFPDADQAAAFLRHGDPIVVYGFDPTCATSRTLATELSNRGFTDVAWYADGLQAWLAAGGHVEGTHDRDRT
jgi:rhodanese-related sulfurtransferase